MSRIRDVVLSCGTIASRLACLANPRPVLQQKMSEARVQITLSLSESVVERLDELLLKGGMESRGAFIDSLLREVLFGDATGAESFQPPKAS